MPTAATRKPGLELHTQPCIQSPHVAQLKGLLTIKDVAAVTRLSKSTIYAKLKEGSFPEPVRLGARCTRWNFSTLETWLSQVGK